MTILEKIISFPIAFFGAILPFYLSPKANHGLTDPHRNIDLMVTKVTTLPPVGPNKWDHFSITVEDWHLTDLTSIVKPDESQEWFFQRVHRDSINTSDSLFIFSCQNAEIGKRLKEQFDGCFRAESLYDRKFYLVKIDQSEPVHLKYSAGDYFLGMDQKVENKLPFDPYELYILKRRVIHKKPKSNS